jgi:hypothetical protein
VAPDPESTAGAPLRTGRLDTTPLPRLLLELAASGHTGELALARGRERARIAWLRGMPVACELEPAGPGLTELLVERSLLASADAERARAAHAARGGAEEVVLLGLGAVAPRDLVVARRDLLVRRLVGLGRLESGDFQVAREPAPPAASEALRVDPLPVVQRILASCWRPDRLLAELEPRLRLFPRPAAGFAPLLARLDPEGGVAGLSLSLDGARSLWALVASTQELPRLAALWVLDACAALDWSETASAPVEAAPVAPPPRDEGPEIEIEVLGGAPVPAAAGSAAVRAARDEASEDARAAELRAEIAEKRRGLAELDHYSLLGIEATAPVAALKRAYLKAAKRFHPDALSRLGLEDLKRDANELFAAITRAHEVLSDPERRREYDAALAGHVQIDADRVAQAESLYRKAELMMRAGQFAGALDLAQGAVTLWPEDAAYQGALGWCLYKKLPPDEARARTHLEKAVALDPLDAVAQLRLAIVLKSAGDVSGAAALTARARQLNPNARA